MKSILANILLMYITVNDNYYTNSTLYSCNNSMEEYQFKGVHKPRNNKKQEQQRKRLINYTYSQ